MTDRPTTGTEASTAEAIAGTPPRSRAHPTWAIMGESVIGASHARRGKPNQDAIAWFPPNGGASFAGIAVADGHGSDKYFRSQEGSRFAVRVATALLEEIAEDAARTKDAGLSFAKREAEARLPSALVRRWRSIVRGHIEGVPLLPSELRALEREAGAAARADVEARPELAYGSTVVAALVTRDFAILLQIGDGEILLVDANGTITRPIPHDDRLVGEETFSLVRPSAEREVKVAFHAYRGEPPALVLVCTDGYSKSFREDKGFVQAGPDILDIIREEGIDTVRTRIAEWLNAATSKAGDDATLGLLVRAEAVQRPMAGVEAASPAPHAAITPSPPRAESPSEALGPEPDAAPRPNEEAADGAGPAPPQPHVSARTDAHASDAEAFRAPSEDLVEFEFAQADSGDDARVVTPRSPSGAREAEGPSEGASAPDQAESLVSRMGRLGKKLSDVVRRSKDGEDAQ